LENQKARAFWEIKREGSLYGKKHKKKGRKKKKKKEGRRVPKKEEVILSCYYSLQRETVEKRK